MRVNSKFNVLAVCMIIFFFLSAISVAWGEKDIKKDIIGKWERYDPKHKGKEIMEFFRDGTISLFHESFGFPGTGDYRFIDNNHIKVNLGGLWTLVGPIICKVSISRNELVLTMPDGEVVKYHRLASEIVVPASYPRYISSESEWKEWSDRAIRWAENCIKDRGCSKSYSDLCLMFVADAFKGASKEANREIKEIAAWDYPNNAINKVKNDFYSEQKDPPRGALVFFSGQGKNPKTGLDYSKYGHIGIYLGNNHVIHAYGVVKKNSMGEIENLQYIGSYLGWAYPPKEWFGKLKGGSMVAPGLQITSNLHILESPPYKVGQTITAEFSIKNNGTAPIIFNILTVGGRVNDSCPQDKCPDFDWKENVPLRPNEVYPYKGKLKLEAPGNYQFFTAYRTKDGKWNTAIPTAQDISNTKDIVVKPLTEKPEADLKERVSKDQGEIVAGELLFNYQVKEIKNLIPLIMFSEGKYSSAWKVLRTNNPLKQKILNIERFWLYYKGTLIGSFKVSGSLSEGEMGMPSFVGKIYWDAKPTVELPLIAENTIALSRQIPQPFYTKDLSLDMRQKAELDRLIQQTLIRSETWYKKLGMKYKPQLIGKAPKSRSIHTFLLEPSGPLAVYVNVRWAGKPCDEIYASILAIWDGKWKVLKRSTYLSECPDRESIGDAIFSMSLVGDIDEDGIAELIIGEGKWESFNKTLYKISNGRLMKLLDVGDYGS